MRNGNYNLVIAPSEYPGKKYRDRYCYEHHLVWWENTGETVKTGEVIHHKNGDHRDNVFSNLEKMKVEPHVKSHNPKKILMVKCEWCKNNFPTSPRSYRFKRKHGQKNFYCSRHCQVTHQQRVLLRK